MSVEKITEEAQSKLPSSTVTDTTRLENVRSNNTSEETPQQLDDGLAADGEKQEEEGSVAAAEQGGGGEVGISVPEPLWKAAKAWFHGLGAEERSAAASFAEEPFLISIVARAASSTARTAAATRSGDRGELVLTLRGFYVAFRVPFEIEPQDLQLVAATSMREDE